MTNTEYAPLNPHIMYPHTKPLAIWNTLPHIFFKAYFLMKNSTVPNSRSDSLISILESLYLSMKNLNRGETVNFDFAKAQWLYPLCVTPLASYIQSTGSTYTVGKSDILQTYLHHIHFPLGIDSVSKFEASVQKQKNYIPISLLRKKAGPGRERLESLFSHMIIKILAASHISGAASAVYYPITELITNVIEHSHAEGGLVFAQFYPKKKYLDLCIVDRGRGLAAAYREEIGVQYTDEEAIIEAMRGHSTKLSKERGYGIRTSKRVVCEGLGGQFVLLSGSTVLMASDKKQRLAVLPQFYWQGVIVAYRIPQPSSPIDITPYIE